MDIKKNLSEFREFIKLNYKNALIYSNRVSQYAGRSFRGDAFKIKSDLAHDVEKDEYLYIPVNLGRVITRIFTDYVIWMGYSVDFGDDKLNEEFVKISDSIQLQLKLNEGVNNQSSIWYGIIRLRNVENKPRVEVVPLPNYCANMEDIKIGDDFYDIKEHYIFNVIKDSNGSMYFYVDRYEKQENGTWKGYYGEKRAYNMDYILTDRIAEAKQEEPLEDLPLYILNNDLDNPHIVGDELNNNRVIRNSKDTWVIPRYFHQSDYVDLADLFQEINDRGSQISVEFIKNLTSKISVPAWFKDAQNIQALKGGNKWLVKNPDYLVHNPWEEPARYITKDATYVQTSINDYIPYLLKLIGFIASIPASLLANAIYGSNNPVGTTEKEFLPFYARVSSKQQRIYSSLQRLFKGIMQIAGHTITELPTIKFIKPASYDTAERTVTAIQQLNAGIMSKESAIAYTMGYDAVEIKEELEKIAEETKNAYAITDTTRVFEEDEEEDENESQEN